MESTPRSQQAAWEQDLTLEGFALGAHINMTSSNRNFARRDQA
jgi:hypothetical protein